MMNEFPEKICIVVDNKLPVFELRISFCFHKMDQVHASTEDLLAKRTELVK